MDELVATSSGGILPLIEAFLAFALTMLGLATAVSSIVGIILAAFRLRAFNLRNLLEYFFRNELAERLEKAEVAAGETPLEDTAEQNAAQELDRRIKFLVDMSLLPDPLLGRQADGTMATATAGAKGQTVVFREAVQDARESKLRAAQQRPATEWWHWRRWLYWLTVWKSLGNCLDRLPTDEFRSRFRDSRAGEALAELHRGELEREGLSAAEIKQEPWLDDYVRRFNSLGQASRESFTRNARSTSVLVGFLLAFAVNIDSLYLLNSYLTSDSLRVMVLAQSKELLAAAAKSSETSGGAELPATPAAAGPETGQSGSVTQRALSSQVERAQGAAADVGASLDQAKALLSELEERFPSLDSDTAKKALEAVETSLGTVSETLSDAQSAARTLDTANAEVVGIVRGLDDVFPIGWEYYPGCPPISPDERCREAVRSPEDGKAGRSLKWFIGVLLTGTLAGLGAPVWVQVVQGALRARNWVRGGTGTETGKPPEQTSGS